MAGAGDDESWLYGDDSKGEEATEQTGQSNGYFLLKVTDDWKFFLLRPNRQVSAFLATYFNYIDSEFHIFPYNQTRFSSIVIRREVFHYLETLKRQEIG
jgi:hypothetical protein